jgi:hypothetical protein
MVSDDARATSAEPLSVEELTPRVREVERLAALGCRLARESLANPTTAAHAQNRIASILREMSELVPGLVQSGAPPAPSLAPSMTDAVPVSSDDIAQRLADPSAEDEALDAGEPDWELDPVKLAAALENETLMSQIPAGDREWFTGLARRVIDSHARAMLATRVRQALAELHDTMEQCRDETSRRLAVAMTFEQLRAAKERKLD